jgi:hypothetical protein
MHPMTTDTFDRFEDALSVVAELEAEAKGGVNYPYMAGYLMSLVRELAHFNPQVAERLQISIDYMERLAAEKQKISEHGYMA